MSKKKLLQNSCHNLENIEYLGIHVVTVMYYYHQIDDC